MTRGNHRILLVSGEYPPDEGGVADYTRCLAEALMAQGLEVHVLTTARGPAEDSVEQSASGISVHRTVAGWGWGAPRAATAAVDELRPDFLHVQYQAAAYAMKPAIHLLPWWVRRRRGVATAVTFHDLLPPYLFPKAGPLRQRSIDFLALFKQRQQSPVAALLPMGTKARRGGVSRRRAWPWYPSGATCATRHLSATTPATGGPITASAATLRSWPISGS